MSSRYVLWCLRLRLQQQRAHCLTFLRNRCSILEFSQSRDGIDWFKYRISFTFVLELIVGPIHIFAIFMKLIDECAVMVGHLFVFCHDLGRNRIAFLPLWQLNTFECCFTSSKSIGGHEARLVVESEIHVGSRHDWILRHRLVRARCLHVSM